MKTPTTHLKNNYALGRVPRWLVVLISVIFGLLIVGGVIFVVVMNMTDAPKKVSDEFVNDVQSANTEAAYALTSEGFRGATSKDDLDAIIKQVSPALQGEEKTTARSVEAAAGSSQKAVIVYTVDTSSGTKYIRVILEKNGDNWRVMSFRSSNSSLEAKIE
ncbi:MAG: hypothetical protein WAW62_00010 [Candidatus Saccharimonas aalborgensis]